MDWQTLPWWGQFLVVLIIGAIIFCVFYFSVYTKTQDKINTTLTKIDEVEREIKRAEQKKDKLPQIRAEKEEKEAVLEKLKEILPERKEITQILKKIESLVGGARLKLNSFTQMGLKHSEIYIQHPYAMSIEGSYHNLGLFFDQLSKLKKIFTVDGLVLTPQTRMTRDFTVRGNFTASTYTYKEKPPAKTSPRRKRR